jgi:LDH2 family malate/lactate/ureidoglycolate dehydrogenase
VERIVGRITGTPTSPGVDRVLLPGEHSAAIREQRLNDGIPIPDTTWEALTAPQQGAAEATVESRRRRMTER